MACRRPHVGFGDYCVVVLADFKAKAPFADEVIVELLSIDVPDLARIKQDTPHVE